MKGLDLSKMREKLDVLENGSNFKKNINVKIDTGDTVRMRVLPSPDGDPFKEFHLHYNINKSKFLCPKRNDGEQCDVCDYVRELYDEGSEESLEQAKDLQAKRRFYSLVLLRGREEEGVKVWNYSKSIYEDFLNKALNPEYGDFTSPESGIDFTVSKKEVKGKRYASINVEFSRKESVLHENQEVVDSILEEIKNFNWDEYFKFEKIDSETVTEKLQAHLAEFKDEAENSAENGGDDENLDPELLAKLKALQTEGSGVSA